MPGILTLYLYAGIEQVRSKQSADENLCRDAACCFSAAIEPGGLLQAGFVTSLEKVYPEPPYCRSRQVQPTAQLALAGNESESVQVIVLASRDLRDVTLTALPFVASQEAQRPDDLHLQVRVVGQVSQVKPKVATSRIGWQPDPLLPNQPVALQGGRPLAFLVTVAASAGTVAGRYSSKLEVHENGRLLATLDLTVQVWNFELPATSRFKTASFPTYEIADKLWPAELGYAPAGDEARMSRFLSLAELASANRLPPLGFIANGLDSRDRYGVSLTRLGFPLYRRRDGVQEFDRAEADRLMDYLRTTGASHFFIGFTSDIYKQPELAVQREQTLLRYLRDYHAYLKEKGLLDKVYVYNVDEPWEEAVGRARRIYKLIKTNFGDDLRVMQNTNQNNDAIIGELLGHFDVLDINLGFYELTALDDYRRRHPQALAEVWWNLNIWPDSRPNLFLEYPLIDARIIGPMSFRFDIQGFEYWHLAALYGIENYHPVKKTELQVDWRVTEKSLDGLLVYPTDDHRFFSSLRLESFRDGMEDQEYLFLLEKLDPGNAMLDVPVVNAIDDYETDVAAYLAFRRNVAVTIERLLNTQHQVPSP